MRYVSFIAFAVILILLFSPIVSANRCNWTGTWEIYKEGSNFQAGGPKVVLKLQEFDYELGKRITGTYSGGRIDGGDFGTGFIGEWSGSAPSTGYPCSESGGDIQFRFECIGDSCPNVCDELSTGHWTCGPSVPGGVWNNFIGRRVSELAPEVGTGSGAATGVAIGALLVETELGTTELKSGDTLPLPPVVRITLGAKCKKFVELVKCMGGNRNLGWAIFNLSIIRAGGQAGGTWTGDVVETSQEFYQAMVDLTKCVYTCGKLFSETNPKLVTQSSFNSSPLLGSSINQSDSAAQIELGLESGPFLAEVVNDKVFLSVKTDTATVTSSGKNTFGVAYIPSIGTTFVAAYQGPVGVQPTNSSLAPFILDAGQIVDVSSGEVGPAVSLDQLGANATAPESGATGVPGTGNATAGNATITGISAPGGPGAPGASSTGTSTVSPRDNNQIGDASDISAGRSVSQTIVPAGSSNFYTFQAGSSGIVKLKLENAPKDMRPYLCLYDKNLAPIVEKSASNAGDTLKLQKDVQGPGQFYIEVKDIQGKAYSEPYTLNAVFEPAPDQYEPNPNYFRATEITQGQSITAYICPSGDEDFYKFYMGSSGIVKATLDSVPADMRAWLQLYDKGLGNAIASGSASSPGDKVKLEKDVQGPGWVYIRVQDADGKAHSKPYTLTVSF